MADECCGGGARPDAERDETPERLWQIRAVQAAVLSGALLAVGLIAAASGADTVASVAFLAGLVVGGSTFVPGTLRSLLRGRLGVGTLMTIAAIGAVLLGEHGEAASLAFLFSISEALEDYALARSRRGLRALLDLVPDRVTVRRGDGEVEVEPGDLAVGDVMIVGPGDRLATDGIIRRGRSSIDLSAITGESVPVECQPGSAVMAASINGGGVLDVEVTAPTADSSLARIVHIVEEAQERKGSSQRLAERVARPLVPGIMVTATAIAAAGSLAGDPELWLGRALVVLVAAAPCAFAISVPVTVVAAIGAATRSGALIKGGAALEALARVRVVALDKTGTLTRNRPVVIEVVPVAGVHADQVLQVAAALEARSEHPLAPAILAAHPPSDEATDVQAMVGSGLTGLVDGQAARLGKPGYLEAADLMDDIVRLQTAGATVVLVELKGRTIGAIAVRDELRPEAPAVIAALRHAGVGWTAMLTGDHRRTAEAIGSVAGVDEIRAELLPVDKVAAIHELQARGPVAMVGGDQRRSCTRHRRRRHRHGSHGHRRRHRDGRRGADGRGPHPPSRRGPPCQARRPDHAAEPCSFGSHPRHARAAGGVGDPRPCRSRCHPRARRGRRHRQRHPCRPPPRAAGRRSAGLRLLAHGHSRRAVLSATLAHPDRAAPDLARLLTFPPLLLAHGTDPSGSPWRWDLHPDVMIVMALVAGAYAVAILCLGPRLVEPGEPVITRRQLVLLALAIGLLWTFSVWPLHNLAEGFSYTIHMLQHTVYTLVAPPLLILGTPTWLWRVALRPVLPALRILVRPPVAVVVYGAAAAATHLPVLANSAVRSGPSHLAQHVVLVGAAFLAWWPLASTLPEAPRLTRPQRRIVYLFLISLVPAIAGSFLIYAQTPTYRAYEAYPHLFGLETVEDLRTGGAVMEWAEAIVLFGIVGYEFIRLCIRELKSRQPAARTPAGGAA